MKAYCEDLRQKVVQAIDQRAMSKSRVTGLYDISLSSVKRYARLASRRETLTPRKGGGRPPKPTRRPRSFSKKTYAKGRLLPSQTGATSLRAFRPKSIRLRSLIRVGSLRLLPVKKDHGGDGTRRPLENRLACNGIREA
jgi:hypothetical protein